MAFTLRQFGGVLAVVLGVAWVIWPQEMSRWQARILFLGATDSDENRTERDDWLGRASGALLALLGLVLVLELTP